MTSLRDAMELRCRVVGEIATSGSPTRPCRVCLNGGHIYTGCDRRILPGVDCSDHEVNIDTSRQSWLPAATDDKRSATCCCVEMTDDGPLVLGDNYAQTLAISWMTTGGHSGCTNRGALVNLLEQSGRLNHRRLGFRTKGTDERLALGQGLLSKPKSPCFLAFSKMSYFESIVASDIHG